MRVLSRQVERLQRRIDQLEHRSKRLSAWRLAEFGAGAVLFYLSLTTGSALLVLTVLALAVAGFVALVRAHNRVDHTKEIFMRWRDIRREHLGRAELNWEHIPRPNRHLDNDTHPFARDLNITGRHSLLQLIDTCHFEAGSQQLKSWLLANRPDRETIEERQALVRELTPMAHFRDRIQLNARLHQQRHDDKDWTIGQLMKWLHTTKKGSYQPELAVLSGLSVANITLFTLYMTGTVAPYVFFTFIAYLLYYNYSSGKTGGLFDEAYQLEKTLREFHGVIQYLEHFSYADGSKLKEFCRPFHAPGERPSRYLKKIIRLAAAASVQANQILWALINFIVPWDLFFASRLNRYKLELAPELQRWMDRLAALEAHCSLANFAWLNPSYHFAVPISPSADEPVLQAQGMGHPLLKPSQKVTNDLRIDELGSLLLITGSNMSGKSTFLRTVGINLALCYAGAPVNARQFRAIPFRLFSSINITDSLDEGLSHFYAEVKQLRKLLDELKREAGQPLFFFVDEIFRGTNNRERLQGSTAFIRRVAGTPSVGMISTHDLELANLEQEIQQMTNYHFEETIENGRMSFEYKLKKGPCNSTNALKIMAMEGLPVPGDDR